MNIKAAIIDHEMASLSEREIFACSQEQRKHYTGGCQSIRRV